DPGRIHLIRDCRVTEARKSIDIVIALAVEGVDVRASWRVAAPAMISACGEMRVVDGDRLRGYEVLMRGKTWTPIALEHPISHDVLRRHLPVALYVLLVRV